MTKYTQPLFRFYFFKIATLFCSLCGVTFSLINATRDGYSHWSKRLLYFTLQSNLWLILCFVCTLFVPLLIRKKYLINALYMLKYVCTVAIAMTAIVFFCFLAPFADSSYHIWSFSSFLTHLFAPIFAVIDFFVDTRPIHFSSASSLFVATPFILYICTSFVLTSFAVDFGRGVPYPYIFFNYTSDLGLLGITKSAPIFGTLYWIFIFAVIALSVGKFFASLKNKTTNS